MKRKIERPVVTKATAMPSIATVGDLVKSLDNEIAEIKAGALSEPKARIVAKNRQLQLQSFQLILAAARIEARYKPELSRRMGMPALPDATTGKPQ